MGNINSITGCEGETMIRQYHCTRYHSLLLNEKADGFLYVTNQRVLLRADGHSSNGESIIQSEIPISDVSGLNFYQGTFFSLLSFLFAVVSSFLLSLVVLVIMGALVGAGTGGVVFAWLVGIGGGILGFMYVPKKTIWYPICSSCASYIFFAISGSSLISTLLNPMSAFYGSSYSGGKQAMMVLAMIIGSIISIYTLYAQVLYARRETFSMSISSKSGMSSPINISGMASLGFANTSAPKALRAEPTTETAGMIKDLGAMIMDIKKYGDTASEKWQIIKRV